MLTERGLSVLGLGPEQNSVTLNGLAFTGSSLPRDARMRTRASTSTYDPSRGGFSGGQVAMELSPGGGFGFRRGRLTLDAPPLQVGDAAGARLGQQFSGVRASAGGDGPLTGDYFYNSGIQVSRREAGVPSLLDGRGGVHGYLGVSPDSVARLVGVLAGLGIPAAVGSGTPSRLSEEGSAIARIDRTPNARRTWGLTAFSTLGRTRAVGVGPTATPARGGRGSSLLAGLHGIHSFYFGEDYLNETRTGVTLNSTRYAPYARVPGGRVLVASAGGDGEAGGVRWLQFGGDATLDRESRDWTWETTNETTWYTPGRPHRLKLSLQSRLDAFSHRPAADRTGTFEYNSLAELEANRPATFARTLHAPVREGGQWSGAASLGDLWRAGPRLQVLYGVRLEANAFTSAPAFNPAILAAFGARTDQAPNSIHAGPRLGFTWRFGGGQQTGTSMMMNPFGTFYRGPSGVLRGGVGEFRARLPSTLLSGALAGTGLPGSTRTLRCVGAAVPVPDWSGTGEDALEQCLASRAPSLSDAAPPVELFDRSFTPPRSWRGNLGWLSSYRKVVFSVEGIYSLNLNQPGTADLNFRDAPRFALAGEGGRPVFVSPASIDPATGALSPVESRMSSEFGVVSSHRSDLRSVSRQLTLTATPELRPGRVHLSLSYTLAGVRAQTRGFDGGAFGSPATREWARADTDVRHQFLLQGGLTGQGVTLTLFGRLASGMPFTPLVAGDVNGDGRANDRAFVLDPATADAGVAGGMRSLLASAPGGARRCLARQLGRAAERNSCTGPWTQSMNARLAFSNRLLRTGRRMNVALNLSNPLGAVDRVLHGSGGLRGWGSPGFADPVLYSVRGFDAAGGRFRYQVNPRFGEVGRSFGVPFRVSVDVSFDLGTPLQVQQLQRSLNQGRAGRPGTRLSADSIMKRYSRTVPSIYGMILQERDSLLLSPDQVGALTEADAAYQARADPVWMELAQYLAGLGDTYAVGEAHRRAEEATNRVWEIAKAEGPTIRAILTPLQLRLAPGNVTYIITTKEKVEIRYFFQ
jgi:hypothetical protein